MKKAIIFRSSQRDFDCFMVDSSEMVKATALGNLLKGEDSLVVGDEVEIDQESGGEYVIKNRLPRRTEIYRMLIRESKKKVTAANCDYLVIVSSISKPNYKRGIIDRFLVRAFQWGIKPIVVFNKLDQLKPKKLDLEFEAARLLDAGVKSYSFSNMEDITFDSEIIGTREDLKKELEGSTAIFLGQSGVGKSTTISSLSEGQVDLKTKEVGKAGKGSHTTTWSEMIDLGNWMLIDSPGIRSFSLEDIPSSELLPLFPDLEEIAVGCKFRDCEHFENSQGCAFYTQVPEEKKDQVFSRLDAYWKILEEIARIPDWKK